MKRTLIDALCARREVAPAAAVTALITLLALAFVVFLSAPEVAGR